MKDFEIADKSYDQETEELTQFLVFWPDGEPGLKIASPENKLLFDPQDQLPFENGMYEFLNGQEALLLSEDPEVIVAPTNNEYAYILRVRGNTVETTPNQASDVLEGVLQVAEEESVDKILNVYDDIMSSQVRQHVINALLSTFEEDERIESLMNGWLIDDFYLVDWAASLYTKDDDPDEGDYQREGGDVVKKDTSYEFVDLNLNRDIEPVEVGINGQRYRLSEREMLFLAKVKWLLNRRHYHPDEPFWRYADQWASVDEETGEPGAIEEDEKPDLDTFSI